MASRFRAIFSSDQFHHRISSNVSIVLEPEETESCNCGNKGCLEQLASATGIVRIGKKIIHDLQAVFGFNSPQAIYKWQNGTALPTVDNLIVLAALLQVRIDDIIITDNAVA